MLSSKVVSKLQQQLAKKPISFSRFNSIHNNAKLFKTQPIQPIIQTRKNQTATTTPIRDTSYPFDWRRKEYKIPELPVGEEMPLQVESTVLGSDIPYMREHIGKLINFTPDDVKKYFPEGPSSQIIKNLDGFTEGNLGLLIREPTLQTISFLDQTKNEGFQNPYMFLDGREGSGKSTIINQAVHWARSNGWLVLFVNNGAEYMNGNYVERSTLFPGMYEQPEFGEALLKGFISAHEEQIKTLKLRTDFTMEGFERNEESTLYDLAKAGIDYDDGTFSCVALFHLRRELNLVTEFPVLVAVDGVNYFYKHSRTIHDPLSDIEDPRKVRFPLMPGDKFVIANMFRNFKKNDMINGTQLVSITHFPNYDDKFMSSELKPENKYVLKVPSYTKEELSIMGDYYTKVGIVRTELSTATRDYIFYLNEGLPGNVLSYMKTFN